MSNICLSVCMYVTVCVQETQTVCMDLSNSTRPTVQQKHCAWPKVGFTLEVNI